MMPTAEQLDELFKVAVRSVAVKFRLAYSEHTEIDAVYHKYSFFHILILSNRFFKLQYAFHAIYDCAVVFRFEIRDALINRLAAFKQFFDCFNVF